VAFKVMRKFERYDGKALRKYTRGQPISDKEASKIPEKTLTRLLRAGSITRVLEPLPSSIKPNAKVGEQGGAMAEAPEIAKAVEVGVEV